MNIYQRVRAAQEKRERDARRAEQRATDKRAGALERADASYELGVEHGADFAPAQFPKNPHYMRGWKAGRDSADRELFGEETP